MSSISSRSPTCCRSSVSSFCVSMCTFVLVKQVTCVCLASQSSSVGPGPPSRAPLSLVLSKASKADAAYLASQSSSVGPGPPSRAPLCHFPAGGACFQVGTLCPQPRVSFTSFTRYKRTQTDARVVFKLELCVLSLCTLALVKQVKQVQLCTFAHSLLQERRVLNLEIHVRLY
jgi:hypothetical protein